MNQTRKMSTLAAAIVVLFHSLPSTDQEDVLNNIDDGDALPPSAVAAQQGITAAGDATLPPPPAAAGSVDLDADQIPWDERIHASTKGKNADGRWKRKRNVDQGTYDKIAASLKSTAAAVPPPPAGAGALPPPPVPAATPTLPPPVVPQAPEYTDLVTLLAQHTNSPDNPTGRLTADWIKALLTNYGVASGLLPDAAVNPALCTSIAAAVRTALGITA